MTGCLTRRLDEYNSCFSVDTQKLEQLFEKDRAEWTQNKVMTKQANDKMMKNIAIFLKVYDTEFAKLLDPAQYMKEPWELNKLDLYGDQVLADQIDFEWPTKQIWDEMDDKENIKVKHFNIVRNDDSCNHKILKIKIILNNGMESPLFCANDSNQGTLEFRQQDNNGQCRKYEFATCKNQLVGLRFFNEKNVETMNWYSQGNRYWQGAQIIPDGQEIVGIYGVKGKKSWISSLGFITRK